MILNGNQRGGAKNLALHLMKQENEHVEVHELRGFASQNLMGALNETYAISRGTRCQKFMYSLSLNPPLHENVSIEKFESAIEQAEERLGLSGQPRAIVFHEKEGRRHCHVVWSRIDIAQMKAIHMPHDHPKLKTLSRELFIEHGWKMPQGLTDSKERNPKNFTHDEWQQAKRIGKNPRAIKTAFQDAWAISDSKAAFTHALEERGYVLARGDRRGFVAVDIHGEVYSVPRQAGVKTKEVCARLGDAKELQSVDEAKNKIAGEMLPIMHKFSQELSAQAQLQKKERTRKLQALVKNQRLERKMFMEKQESQQKRAALVRQSRFRTGLKGVWDKLRGEHKRISTENEQSAMMACNRDRREKDEFIAAQLAQRRMYREHSKEVKANFYEKHKENKRDISHFKEMKNGDTLDMRAAFIKARQGKKSRQSPQQLVQNNGARLER